MVEQRVPIWIPTPSTDIRLPGIRVMHGGPVAMRLPEHAHPEAQVEVHFRSKATAPYDSRSSQAAPLEPAESVVITPHQPHFGRWDHGSEVVVLLVSPDALDRAADELLVRNRFRIRTNTVERSPLLQQVASELRRELRSPFGASRFYVENAGHLAAGYLVRHHAEAAPGREISAALSSLELRRADEFIDEHLEAGISVEGLAAHLRIGPQRLSRCFRLATGRTPYQYVQHRRLECAKRLLSDRRLSLAEVACRLGFASQRHFTASFRRDTGTTPKMYRQVI